MKTIIWIVGAIVVLVIGFFAFNSYIYNEKQADVAANYKDVELIIAGERIKLSDGLAETEDAPGSASKVVTRYFGNEARGDLDNDSDEDIVFLLTQERGGSGTFYYLAAAIKEDGGYRGTEAVFIGDRIAPQTTEFKEGQIIVNYADRAPGEPMTAEPSVGKSLFLKYDAGAMQFGEVVQGFEGEADPSRMTLGMKEWVWQLATYEDGREVAPNTPGEFTLTFEEDGTLAIGTDCNSMSASYEAENGELTLGPIVSTKMFCEGSQEGVFAELVENATGYHFTSRGELILDLKFDSGSVMFR